MSSNGQSLAKTQSSALAGQMLDREQVELVKRTIAKDASDNELALFIQQCNRRRLDPFARQIYLVKRWDGYSKSYVAETQVSIDGQRLVAERTGKYEGQTPPQWCGKDGKWVDIWTQDAPPYAARVGVYKSGFREPVYRVAKYDAFVQTKRDGNPNKMWAQMPDHMLAKCAESNALRAAFPEELSGLYTPEEMGQAQNPGPAKAKAKPRTLDDVAKPTATDAAAAQHMGDDAEMATGSAVPGEPDHRDALAQSLRVAKGEHDPDQPFGYGRKYRDTPVKDIPAGDLTRIINEGKNPSARELAEAELERRRQAEDEPPPPVDDPYGPTEDEAEVYQGQFDD